MLRVVRWRGNSVSALPLMMFGMSMAFSGCHAALSSQGTPHSQYQGTHQATSQPKPSHSPQPHPSTSPNPATSASPSPSPSEDLTQESLTLLSAADVQKEDDHESVSYDGRTLQLTFLQNLSIKLGTLEKDSDAEQGSYYTVFAEGQETTEADVQQKNEKISCKIHYILSGTPNPGDPNPAEFVIGKNQVLTFTRSDQDPRDEDKIDSVHERVAILLIPENLIDAKAAGQVVRISCKAPADDSIAPAVSDLVTALGGSSVVQATVKAPSSQKPPANQSGSSGSQKTSSPAARSASAGQGGGMQQNQNSSQHTMISIDRHTASVTGETQTASNPTADNSANASQTQDLGQSTVKKSLLIEHDESLLAAKPDFAIQAEGSMNAFGGSTISPAQQGVTSKAVLLETEYQPAFLQKYGVLGIGPSIGMYPTTGTVASTGQTVVNGPTSLWEVGAQVRYQFRYFNQQLIVPFVGYNYQRLSYNIQNQGGNSSLSIAGGSAGLSILLNHLDESAALDLYRATHISRLYLVAEMKNLQGSDDNVAVAGSSFFFGIRCEL